MEQVKRKFNTWVVIGAIIGGSIGSFAVNQIFFSKPSFDKVMVKVCNDLNKNCPFMVDSETRLDNTITVNNSLQYNYTLVNMDVADLDINALRDYVEKNVVTNTKTNPDMKIFRENNATINYAYKDKNGVFLFKIEVTPDKYNNKS